MNLKAKRARKIAIIVIVAAVLAGALITQFYPKAGGGAMTVTMTIECSKVAPYRKKTSAKKDPWVKYVPKDYLIFKKASVPCKKGDTVYDVFKSVCRKNKIRYVNKNSGLGSGAYISSVNFLEEKAVGRYSGWTYYVNGKMPDVSADQYDLKDGDDIVWSYTVSK